jgi:hypothetical protein
MKPLASVLLIVTSLFGNAPPKAPKVKAGDFKRLAGAQWKGALTYLDYRRNKKVSIPTNLTVSPSPGDPLSWTFEYLYPEEPQANSKMIVTLGKDGRTVGGETVVERTALAGKTVKVVTEQRGTDNDRPALLRRSYLLGATRLSIKKEVRYDGAGEFFERNEYSWSR